MKNLQVERESTVLLPSCSRDASEGFEFCVAASEGRLFIASAGGSVACVALSTYEVFPRFQRRFDVSILLD